MHNVGDRERFRQCKDAFIGANEVWFHVVVHEPRQRTQSDPDFGSGLETRSHKVDHMRELAYIKNFYNYKASA